MIGLGRKKFIKRVEDFTCEVCGAKVKGTGYTDHCPRCLMGKHVDVFPGDRAAECGGLMEPIGVTQRKGERRILYRCQRCGLERFNRAGPNDDLEKIIELSTRPIKPSPKRSGCPKTSFALPPKDRFFFPFFPL